jgi:glutamate dehydrogenase
VLEYNVCWLTRRRSELADPERERSALATAVQRLQAWVPRHHHPDPGSALEQCLTHLAARGAPVTLTDGCRVVSQLQPALALASAAAEHGFDVTDLARQHQLVCTELRLSWLTGSIPVQPADTHWTQLAKSALHDELTSLCVAIACDVLDSGGLPEWTSRHAAALERASSSYAGLATSENPDVAMLTVGVQVLRDLRHAIQVGGDRRR